MAVEENFLIDCSVNLIIQYIEKDVFVTIMQRVFIILGDIHMEMTRMVNFQVIQIVSI